MTLLNSPSTVSSLGHDDDSGCVASAEVYHKYEAMDDNSSTGSFSCKTISIRNGCVVTFLSYGKVIAFGQLLSFLLAASGAASATLHIDCKITVPAFTTFCLFVLLAVFLIPLYIRGERWKQLQEEGLRRRKFVETPLYSFGGIALFAPVGAYCMIGLLDVFSDFLNFLSYKYTTLTSNTVFGSLSVPAAMVLSKICLGRQYRTVHILGAMVCIAGVAIDVLMDYKSSIENKRNTQQHRHAQEKSADDYFRYYMYEDDYVEETFFDYDEDIYPNKVLGDIMAIAGGIMYGAHDVVTEFSARHFGGPMECLAMTGVWGILFSGIATLSLEREELKVLWNGTDGCTPGHAATLVAVAVTMLFLHMAGAAYFVLFSESAMLNLSLLTMNFWAVGFSIFVSHISPDPAFYLALALIVVGIVIYESGPSPIPKDETAVIDALPNTKAEFEAAMHEMKDDADKIATLDRCPNSILI